MELREQSFLASLPPYHQTLNTVSSYHRYSIQLDPQKDASQPLASAYCILLGNSHYTYSQSSFMLTIPLSPSIMVFLLLMIDLQSLVDSFAGLLSIRIFLGLCEGGLLPGMVCFHELTFVHLSQGHLQILYLSTIYKRHELQLRVGIFYASGEYPVTDCTSLIYSMQSASLSGAFGG